MQCRGSAAFCKCRTGFTGDRCQHGKYEIFNTTEMMVIIAIMVEKY